jgi:hypothetical protein
VEALIGIAAVTALALVALPWLIGPRGGVTPPGSETDSPAPSIEPTAAPTQVPLAHAQKWLLSFDYPAAWTLRDQEIPAMNDPNPWLRFLQGGSAGTLTRFGRSIGFLGSGSASDSCVQLPETVVPGAGTPSSTMDADPMNLQCTTHWSVPAGGVEIRFWVNAMPRWNGLSAIAGVPAPGYTPTTVDGLAALFARSTNLVTAALPSALPSDFPRPDAEVIPDADEVLSWVLPTQISLGGNYTITAAIRGPNVAELESQVQAMVASLHWVPEPYRLPTDAVSVAKAESAAVAVALPWLRTSRWGLIYANQDLHFFDCFPMEPGASATATITWSMQGPLKKPLPVACKTDIAPNVMQGWTLSLTQSWAAGSDYAAGEITVYFDLKADGTVAEMDQDRSVAAQLQVYPNQGSSGPG